MVTTRLEMFLTAHRVSPSRLAAEAGISRARLRRLRLGRSEPTRAVMIALRAACARIAGHRLAIGELFDLADDITVTREDGERFADVWLERAMASDVSMDAFSSAGVLPWPESESSSPLHDVDLREAQAEFHELADEICERTFRAARAAIATAFVDAVTAVLARADQQAKR